MGNDGIRDEWCGVQRLRLEEQADSEFPDSAYIVEKPSESFWEGSKNIVFTF